MKAYAFVIMHSALHKEENKECTLMLAVRVIVT